MKLKNKNLNLVCILTILTSMLSCGKEVTGGNNGSSTNYQDKSALLGNSIELTYNMETDYNSYTVPKAGWAKIPDHPIIVSGEPDSFRSSIFFNTSSLSISAEAESIRCDYSSKKMALNFQTGEIEYDHYFKGCFASIYSYEEEVNYQPGQEILLDVGKQIIFNVIIFDESDDIEIISDIKVDWH